MSEMNITPESYARWLQAQQPGDWFFTLAEGEQIALADQGVIYRLEAALDLARAVRDPELFEAQVYADDDQESAEFMTKRLAAAAVAELLGAQPQEPPPPETPPPPSLAGVIERREAIAKDLEVSRRLPFLGKPADDPQEVPG